MIKCVFENGKESLLRHVCIDAIVLKGEKVLLVKRAAGLLEGGKWGIVGGFVERNETTSQAVAREVLEETGYGISGVTLLAIRDNPDRPDEDRQNFSFVFFCEAGEKPGLADAESSAQVWFALEDLPSEGEMAFDHRRDIEIYLKFRREGVGIPLIFV